ncbi:hypothetical protein [Paenibacillus sp. DR312]|uniref:hypothetical protein n=1 Tax=unclassified Paenibacillus TaxID=185978 RepID=UPI001C93CA3B|nr:hypothetical protein [Paenibacillus sp. DR312]QZN76175.1 hypothetical protein K5K90_02380 [Paenibacillus sp. DR312]
MENNQDLLNHSCSNAIKLIHIIYEQEEINDDDINKLLQRIDNIIFLLKEDVEVNCSDLSHIKDSINNVDDSQDDESRHLYQREYITHYLMHLYKNQERISDEDKYLDRLSDINNKIIENTHQMYSSKINLFYKNFMPVENQKEFERMTDLIRDELRVYGVNLFYCKKIINFLNEEFSQQGVFPADLFFIKQFVHNSFFVLILTSEKLFSDANINKKKNFGFEYLKNQIINSCSSNEISSSVQGLFRGEFRNFMNQGKRLRANIKDLRDSYIAHYDIYEIEHINKVELELLENIYEISVKLFKSLSLNRFERLDISYTKRIKIHGFKKIVCDTPLIHEKEHTDIDSFLDVLRKNFKDNLQTRK